MKVMNSTGSNTGDKYPENIYVSPVQEILEDIATKGETREISKTFTIPNNFSKYKYVYVISKFVLGATSVSPEDPTIKLTSAVGEVSKNITYPIDTYIPNSASGASVQSSFIIPYVYSNNLFSQYYDWGESSNSFCYVGDSYGNATSYLTGISTNSLNLKFRFYVRTDAYNTRRFCVRTIVVGFY